MNWCGKYDGGYVNLSANFLEFGIEKLILKGNLRLSAQVLEAIVQAHGPK